MIKRYSVREIDQIFSNSNKYKIWLEIELCVLKYLATKKVISEEDYFQMKDDLMVIPSQVRRKEKIFNHDVVAFINHIVETTECRARKWIHYGLTSSDLVDTGNSVMIRQANKVLFRKIEGLLSRLKRISLIHKNTYCANREKGFEIDGAMSFGYVFATCYEDIKQTVREIEKNKKYVECASTSGSMGIFSHVGLELQDFVAKELGLHSANCSTQVLSRDRYYRYFELLNRVVQSIYGVCVKLRLLTRTEIGEVSEAFYREQMGSSSMPHKRNPITLENICGLCRLFGSYCSATSKNIPIWFERDISHSSVDRIVFLDGLSIAVQVIQKFRKVLDGMQVDSERMKSNIKKNQYKVYGKYLAKSIFNRLEGNVSFKEINKNLDEINRQAIESGVSFREMLEKSSWGENSQELFDLSNHLGFFRDVYERIFCEEDKKSFFDNVFYDEEEIVNSVDAIAIRLNDRYGKRIEAVRMIALRDESVVFLSRLLPKLDFPVELHTIDVCREEYMLSQGQKFSSDWFEIYGEYVRGQDVLLVSTTFRQPEIINLLKSKIKKLGAKSSYVVSLFVRDLNGVDLFGLKLPTLSGVAGFGIGNLEGRFSNCGFVGKLKANFIENQHERH